MSALTKADILARTAPAPAVVEVPEWGGSVTVRLLTGTERDALYTDLVKRPDGSPDMRDMRARVVSAAVVGEDGGPMFTHAEALTLDDTQASAMLRLFIAAQRINLLGPDDLESATKN